MFEDYAAVIEDRADDATRARVAAMLADPGSDLARAVAQARHNSAGLLGWTDMAADQPSSNSKSPMETEEASDEPRWRRLWNRWCGRVQISDVETVVIKAWKKQRLESVIGRIEEAGKRAKHDGQFEYFMATMNGIGRILADRFEPGNSARVLEAATGGRWGWLDDPATHNEPYLVGMELLADSHERLGNLRDASFYLDRAAHIVGCLHGFESLDYVHRLVRAANMMTRAGYGRSARLALNEAKTLAERAAGTDHPLVVEIQETIRSRHSQIADRNSTTEVSTADEVSSSSTHPTKAEDANVDNVTMIDSTSLPMMGRDTSADADANRADDHATSGGQFWLSMRMRRMVDQHRYVDAIAIGELLRRRYRQVGVGPRIWSDLLLTLAIANSAIGNSDSAEKDASEACDVRSFMLGRGNFSYFESLFCLARVQRSTDVGRRVLDLLEQAELVLSMWNVKHRRRLHRELLAAKDEVAKRLGVPARPPLPLRNPIAYRGDDSWWRRIWTWAAAHAQYEVVDYKFTAALDDQDYVRALDMALERLDVTRRIYTINQSRMSQALAAVGNEYRDLGQFRTAAGYLLERFALAEMVFGAGSAVAMRDLVRLYAMSESADQEQYWRTRCEDIERRFNALRHPNARSFRGYPREFVRDFQNVANSLRLATLMATYAEAARSGDQALLLNAAKERWDICRRIGELDEQYIHSFRDLVGAYRMVKVVASVEELCQEAAADLKERFDSTKAQYSTMRMTIAAALQDIGRLDAAESLLNQEILGSAAEGRESIGHAHALLNVALIYGATHREDKALELLQQVLTLEDANAVNGAAGPVWVRSLSAWATSRRDVLDAFLSLVQAYFANNTAAVQDALDATLRRKVGIGVGLTEERWQELATRWPGCRQDLQRASILQFAIARKTGERSLTDNRVQHRKLIARYRADLGRIFESLTKMIPELAKEHALSQASHRAVAMRLDERQSLVEFVRYRRLDFARLPSGDSPWVGFRYAAFVLHAAESGRVQMFDLGDADPIDALVADFRMSVETPNARSAGDTLRQVVFDPIASEVRASESLVLAADGSLDDVEFSMLQQADGASLGDTFSVRKVDSGSELLLA